jgi:hypothetical protein
VSEMDRTRAAFAEYDRIGVLMETWTEDQAAEELNELAASYERAQAQIGESFYLDTADRNRREDCIAEAKWGGAGLDYMRRAAERTS